MSSGHNLEAHLFVCTNSKKNGTGCATLGSEELRNQIKTLCQEEARGWHGRVRVNTSGCLGRCEKGIAAVLYPQAEWMENLKKEDAPKLEALLKKYLG